MIRRIMRCNYCCCIVFGIPMLSIFSSPANASAASVGSLEWVRNISSAEVDGVNGVFASGGDSYVAGFTTGVIGAASHGSGDGFIRKYDSAGNTLWTQQIGTSLNDDAVGIIGDGAGNLFVTGDFGAPEGGFGNSSAFVHKYDSAGNLQWARSLESNQDDRGESIAVDSSGRIFIAGITRGSLNGINAGQLDAFVASYNANGDFLWVRQLGTTNQDYAASVAIDGLGNVFITGSTFSTLEGLSAGGRDAYLAKYNSGGDLQWIEQFGTSGDDVALAVAADLFGNVFVTGGTEGSLGSSNAGANDLFVRKFDTDRNLVWTRQIGTSGGDVGRGLALDGAGGIYFAGGAGGVLGDASFGGSDAIVGRLDAAGNIDWIEQYGGSGSEGAFGLSFDGQHSLFAAGLTFGSFGGPLAGFTDGFIIKVNTVPEPASMGLGSLAFGTLLMVRRRAK